MRRGLPATLAALRAVLGNRRFRPRLAGCLRFAPRRRRRTLRRRPPRRRRAPCRLPGRLRLSRRRLLVRPPPSPSSPAAPNSSLFVRMAPIAPPTVPSMAIARFGTRRRRIVPFGIGACSRTLGSLTRPVATPSCGRSPLRAVLLLAAVAAASLVPLRRRRLPRLRSRRLCRSRCRSLCRSLCRSRLLLLR
jgi:hypothetical protein